MSSAIESLENFITRAERDRKYALNTAAGMRAALNMFAAAMNEEERESLDVMRERLDQIYNEVFRQKNNKMSSGSLKTYYNRVRKVLNDHDNYNHDPEKYNKWLPPRRSHAPKPNQSKGLRSKDGTRLSTKTEASSSTPMASASTSERFEIIFENGHRALLILPARRSKADVQRLTGLMAYLEATASASKDVEGEEA